MGAAGVVRGPGHGHSCSTCLSLQMETQGLDVRSESIKVCADLIPTPHRSGNLAVKGVLKERAWTGHLVTVHVVLSLLLPETTANHAAADTHRTGLPTSHSAHACPDLHPTKWGHWEDTRKRTVGLDEDPGACCQSPVCVLPELCS